MNLNYEILFITEVLNDYFGDMLCADLNIIPSDDTAKILRGHQMLCKTVDNKLVILVKIDPDSGQPLITLDAATRLRFYISVNNPDFINYTNINYAPLKAGKYYFSNINQNKQNTVLYLSGALALYKNTNTYSIGDLVVDGSNNVYEAISGSSNANKHGLGEKAFWLKKGVAQYVNGKDTISLTGSSYAPAAAAATGFVINIYGLNTATNVYNSLQLSQTQTFVSAQTPASIDLSGLTVGKYRVSINGTDSYIYLDDAVINKNILGVMEVFNHLPAANDFSLFDVSGVPKESTFTIRFANRSAIWKYIARTNDVTAVKDTASVYTFNAAGTNTFTSSVPIPFSDQPITTISIHSTTLGKVTQIGNPGSNRLTLVFQAGEYHYYTEKHLNY